MLTTCSCSLKQQLNSVQQTCSVAAASLIRMYATSAAKKPTPPPPDQTSSTTTTTKTAAAAASTATKTTTTTADNKTTSSSASSKSGSTVASSAAVAATTQAAAKMASQSNPIKSTATTTTSNNKNNANNSNLRLVDYLTRKDMERNVVMDMVTKSEVKFYDPPYLARDAPFPTYAELNINLKGYEFSVLESYHNFIARLCKALDVDVKDIYAMPARTYKIKTYRPFSSNLDKEYSLKMYHRVVRVKNLKSTTAPLLFEAIQLNLPEGVQLSVGEPSVEEDNFRYVPDLELKELKQQLEEFTKTPTANPTTTAAATTTTASTTTPQTTATSTTTTTSSTSANKPKK